MYRFSYAYTIVTMCISLYYTYIKIVYINILILNYLFFLVFSEPKVIRCVDQVNGFLECRSCDYRSARADDVPLQAYFIITLIGTTYR